MYSPLGLVIFVAVEGTLIRFTKGHDHFQSDRLHQLLWAGAITETSPDGNSDNQNGNTRNGECRLGSHNIKNVTTARAVTSRFLFYFSKSRSRSIEIYSSRSRSSSKKIYLSKS